MKSLEYIITGVLGTTHILGDDSKNITQKQIDEIKAELSTRIKQLDRRIKVLIGLIIIIFLIIMIAISFIPETKEEMATYCTLIGLSPVTIGSMVLSFKKEYEQTKILLEFVESMNKENIISILTIFLSLLTK